MSITLEEAEALPIGTVIKHPKYFEGRWGGLAPEEERDCGRRFGYVLCRHHDERCAYPLHMINLLEPKAQGGVS